MECTIESVAAQHGVAPGDVRRAVADIRRTLHVTEQEALEALATADVHPKAGAPA